MSRRRNWWNRELYICLVVALLSLLIAFSPLASGQEAENGPPQMGEGALMYRSPSSQQYQIVPLLHTDAALDVRGLVASATVTQQYVNSSTEPIEAVYVFPLPHDAAVYDMEIRVGNRVIHSVIKEREEAKQTYEKAKSEGKRAALLEQERPNIFTASVANIMPGDKVDVRMRYVQPLSWEDGKVRLVFPMVVGPRYIPGTESVGHSGTGWSYDTERVADASRITPPVPSPETRAGHDISVSVDLDTGSEPATLHCVSHDIAVSRLPDGRQHVELSTGKTIPNKDFVLEVQRGDSTQAADRAFSLAGHELRGNAFPAGGVSAHGPADPARAGGNALYDRRLRFHGGNVDPAGPRSVAPGPGPASAGRSLRHSGLQQ